MERSICSSHNNTVLPLRYLCKVVALQTPHIEHTDSPTGDKSHEFHFNLFLRGFQRFALRKFCL